MCYICVAVVCSSVVVTVNATYVLQRSLTTVPNSHIAQLCHLQDHQYSYRGNQDHSCGLSQEATSAIV